MKNHPTVKWYHENYDIQPGKMDRTELNYEQVKEFAREAGADDCGIADINSSEFENERKEILALFPKTKAVISIVLKLNRENVQCVSRSVSDNEFIQGFERSNAVSRKLTTLLQTLNINALHP